MATTRQNPRDPDLNLQFKCIADSFIDNLTPDDKNILLAANLADAILQDATMLDQRNKAQSTGRKISQKLKPFIEGINQYGSALDVISNASSVFLCPIWGACKVVLHIAQSFGEYFDKLTNMFERIGRDLISLKRYPALYPENQRLKQQMVRVYQIVFEFLSKSRDVFLKAYQGEKKFLSKLAPTGLRVMSKLLWKPFKQQFGDLQSALYEAMDAIKEEVTLAEHEQSALERQRAEDERRLQALRWELEKTHIEEVKADRSSTREEQSAARVENWLSPADYVTNHRAAVKLRHQGTGLWFCEGQEFQHWLNEENSFLWLHAEAGVGKTVLISGVIDYLKQRVQRADVGFAYFYCDYKDAQKQQPSAIMSTLLAQLARQKEEVFHRVLDFFNEHQEGGRASTAGYDELRSNFPNLLESAFQEVILVVDAIDECADQSCIMYGLQGVMEALPSLKVLISSREEVQITKAFEKWSFPRKQSRKMKKEDVKDDIASFVRSEIAIKLQEGKLKIRDPTLQSTICDALLDGADGMFQWVRCQVDHICTLRTDKSIKLALGKLPKTLGELYLRILQRIERDYESDVSRIQKILRWLVRGTRSLRLDELSECTGINLEESPRSFDSVDHLTDPRDILEMCSSLITVSSEDSVVSLAHYTVKEYLTSSELASTLKPFYVAEREVEAELAKTCLTYLLFEDFDDFTCLAGMELSRRDSFENDDTKVLKHEPLKAISERYKFFDYAVTSWGKHAHRGGDDPELTELTMELFQGHEKESGNYRLWLQMYWSRRLARQRTISRYIPPLYFASLFGLATVIRELHETGEIITEGEEQYSPLTAAASEGHRDALTVLLEDFDKPSNVNLERCLYIAASKGHTDIVRLLIEREVSIDTNSGKHRTALITSALHGHKAVVELLIRSGASTKSVDTRFGTPLAAAAEKGHQGVSKFLLDHGASPNGRGGWFSTPLISAIVGRNDAIVHMILEQGANLNAQGGRHVCALMAAAYLGNLKLVKELIDRGARVNDYNDKGADALHSACCTGHLSIVEVLLESGADVNAKGGKHRNALNAACAGGFSSIVEMLLKSGADQSNFDEHYGNCMQAACLGGHDDIVRILAKAGVDVNADGGTQKGTALQCATNSGKLSTVTLLFDLGLKKGPTQEIADALVMACTRSDQAAISLLVQKGADLEAFGRLRSGGTSTPLQVASHKGDLDLTKFLLGLGANPNTCGGFFTSALTAGVDSQKCNIDVLQALLDAGASVNEKSVVSDERPDPFSCALAAAVGNEHIDAYKLLMSHGADVDIVNKNRTSVLMEAVTTKNQDILDLVLANGADVNLEIEIDDDDDDDGTVNALEVASKEGNEFSIRTLFARGASMTHEGSETRFKNALQVASFYGQLENAKVLLELGADPNTQGGRYGTSLQAAAYNGHCEITDLLLTHGADVNASEASSRYGNALMAATLCDDENRRLEPVKLLLQRGADPNIPIGRGHDFQYPLQAAASSACDDEKVDEIVELLVTSGADVNKKGGSIHTALIGAVKGSHGHPPTVKFLIESGADIHAVGGLYGTALAAAYSEGYYLITDLLFEHGASPNLRGGRWRNPLGAALSGACDTMIAGLLRYQQADPNNHCGKWGSPLHYSISSGRSSCADRLLKFGADVNVQGGSCGTPLTAAAIKHDKVMVENLLGLGANVNATTDSRFPSAVIGACGPADEEVLACFFEHGADLNTQTGLYGSAIQAAAQWNSTKTVRWLIDHGADIQFHHVGRYGDPIQAAAMNRLGSISILRILIQQGCDVNAKNGRFGHALQAAAVRGNAKAVLSLLRAGAKVNDTGGRHHTALKAAVACGNEEVVRILLRHGADVNLQGGKYWTALQAACVFGKTSTIRLLLSHGADPQAEGGFYGSALQAAAIRGWADAVGVLLYEACPQGTDAEEETEVKSQQKTPNTTLNRKLNHAKARRLAKAEDILKSSPSPPARNPEEESSSQDKEAQSEKDEYAGLDDDVDDATPKDQGKPPAPQTNGIADALTWPKRPALAEKFMKVRHTSSAIETMKKKARAKTMRELGFGDDTPADAWLQWERGDD